MVFDGRIFVMGDRTTTPFPGVTEMWWFDPDAREWERAADLPHGFDHVGMVPLGDRIYVIGGLSGASQAEDEEPQPWNAHADVWAYHPATDTWEQMGDFPAERGSPACTGDGELIYCAGGIGDDRTVSLADVLVYEPSADTWSLLTTLPTPRDHAQAALLDGVLWVIGGRTGGARERPTLAVEGYDLASGEWRSGAELPVPQSGGGLAVVEGRLIAFGGEGPRPGLTGAAGARAQAFDETHAYDPASDEWAALPSMPLPVHGQAVATVDGRVHSIGGGVRLDVPGSDLHQVLIFEP